VVITVDDTVALELQRWLAARPAPSDTEQLLVEIRTLYLQLPDGQHGQRVRSAESPRDRARRLEELNRQMEAIAEKSRRFVGRPGEAMVVALTCG